METNKATTTEPNNVIVNGKVQDVKDYQGNYYTQVTLPSRDEYSDTNTVSIRSKHRLTAVGELITQLCSLGGYTQSFQTRDGEKAQRTTIVLDAVT